MSGVNVKTAANRIYQEYRQDFMKAFDEAPSLWPEYATEIPSSSRSTLHVWLGDQSAVREWKGPRIARGMGTRTWEVVNRSWELTHEFDADQIDDDMEGLVSGAIVKARNNGMKWRRHEDKLVADTLELGLTANCWDGQYFFDTDHPTDIDAITSGTFSNKLTGSALTFANYNTALQRFSEFKNEDGSPMIDLGVGLALMVPPALNLTGRQIVSEGSLTPGSAISLYGTGGPSQNPFAGSARLIVNPFLTSTTRWFLMAVGGAIKPLMFQRRQAVQYDEQGPGSALYFEEKKIRIGTDARYEASFTLPQLAICADA